VKDENKTADILPECLLFLPELSLQNYLILFNQEEGKAEW